MTSDTRRKRIENFYRISALNDRPVLIECTDIRQNCLKDALKLAEPKIIDSEELSKDVFGSEHDTPPKCPKRLPTGSFSILSSAAFDFIEDECSYDLDDIHEDILNAFRRILPFNGSPDKNLNIRDICPATLNVKISQNHAITCSSPTKTFCSRFQQPSLLSMASKKCPIYDFDDMSSFTFEGSFDMIDYSYYNIDDYGGTFHILDNFNLASKDKNDACQSNFTGRQPPSVPRRRSTLSTSKSSQTIDPLVLEKI